MNPFSGLLTKGGGSSGTGLEGVADRLRQGTPAPKKAAGPSAADQKVIKSFKLIDPARRSVVLETFAKKAKVGDQEAARKLQLLAPLAETPAPATPDYRDKSLSGRAFQASQGLQKLVGAGIDLASGSTGQRAGETVERAPGAPVRLTDAGRTNSQLQVALDALKARTLLAGGAGKTLVSTAAKNAAVGGGYNLASAVQEGKSVMDTARSTAEGAAIGGVLGASGSLLGKAVSRIRASKAATEAAVPRVVAEKAAPRPAHQMQIEAAVTKGDMPEVARIINAMPDSDPYKRSMAELFKDRVPPGSLGHIAQDVGSDVLPTAPKLNLSSRAQHFDEALQDSIKRVEKSPGYQGELAARGGDQVITRKEVLGKAKELGPLSDAELLNAKPLDKVDTVTITRAHATDEAAARELQGLRDSGAEVTSPEFQAAAEHFGQLHAGYKIMTGEAGRALNIQGSFVDTGTRLQEKIAKIVETTKGATEADRKTLINKAIKEAEKEIEREYKDLNPSVMKRLQDMVAEYATAAKLTSPLTHGVNLLSNLLNLPVKAAENLVEASWGAAKGETSVRQARYIFGTWKGLGSAVSQFGHEIKQSLNPSAADITTTGKVELRPGAIPGKLGKVVRTPFNLLSAADNMYKTILRDSELHQRAFAKAYQEGFRGDKLKGRIDELVKSPTDDMTRRAEKVAAEFTFTAEPGPIVQSVTGMLEKVPVLRLLIPFVRTPTNIAKFQVQRGPLGVFAPRNIKDIMNGGTERLEAVARIAVGTGMTLGAVSAAMNLGDSITGAAPSDAGEKDLFYSSGKKPYSIKVGNRWVAYNRFAPVGLYLTQAVGLRDALVKGDSKTAGNVFTSLVGTTAKGLADLPFVSGISGVIDALNDPTNPERLSKALASPVMGLIPNVSRDIASASDPIAREAKTPTDQLKMMIPGLRQQVKPRVDVLGQVQNQSDMSPAERGLVKITSKDKSSKLSQALDEIGRETGYYPQPPKATAKVSGKVLRPDDFLRYQALSGRKFASKLEQALNNADFRGLSPDDKQRTVEAMVSDARKQAAGDLFDPAEKKSKPAKIKRY